MLLQLTYPSRSSRRVLLSTAVGFGTYTGIGPVRLFDMTATLLAIATCAGWREYVPNSVHNLLSNTHYQDQFQRVSWQAKQGAVARRKRKLMTVEGGIYDGGSGVDMSKYTVNGVEMGEPSPSNWGRQYCSSAASCLH